MLRQLITDGLIAPGDVDERSITEVSPDDLKHYTQCHFFAGIGGWSSALRLAGWPDDRPVWTGSAPCQPFSSAGRQKGKDDERHLWPYFFKLIATCKPPTIFGEQVASAVGYGWFDDVATDLEGVYFGHDRESLHRLQDPETFDRVSQILWEVKRGRAASLQGLPTGIREEVAQFIQRIQSESTSRTPSQGHHIPARLDVPEQGSLFGIGMPQAVREEEYSVQPRPTPARVGKADCGGDMRGERVLSGQHPIVRQEVQHAILGQDKPKGGIPLRECADSGLCRECCDGGLGRGELQGNNENVDGQINDKMQQSPSRQTGNEPQAIFAHGWLDDVYSGLEAEGYAVGSAVLPACSVGAPHRRDRLWFVAHASSQRRQQNTRGPHGYEGADEGRSSQHHHQLAGDGQGCSPVADAASPRPFPCSLAGVCGSQEGAGARHGEPQRSSSSPVAYASCHGRRQSCENPGGCSTGVCAGQISGLALPGRSPLDNSQQPRLEGHAGYGGGAQGRQEPQRPAPTAGFWSDGEWLFCADQKYRLIEPSIPLLADGVQHRRPILHALGNAIVPQVAAEFIKAVM